MRLRKTSSVVCGWLFLITLACNQTTPQTLQKQKIQNNTPKAPGKSVVIPEVYPKPFPKPSPVNPNLSNPDTRILNVLAKAILVGLLTTGIYYLIKIIKTCRS